VTYRVETNRRLILVEARSGMTAAVQAKPMLTRGERVQMVTLVSGQPDLDTRASARP
jgi:hypothetical protein